MKNQQKIELVVASRNKKKIKEIKQLLKGFNLKVTCLADYSNAPYVNENGKTFQENAIKKAVKIARFTKKLTLGEDSGLEVAALGGKPGIRSARFAGRDKSDAKNNSKILSLLEGLPPSKRKARYVCAVALADEGGLFDVVEGFCSGSIGFKPQGSSGFGYDPLFVIPKHKKTFAQLGLSIKHTMSHRFRALKKAKAIIKGYLGKDFDKNI